MTIWLWLAFLLLVGTLVVLDLGLLTRRPRVVTALEAMSSTALWVLAAVGFSFLISYVYETNWQNLEASLAFPIEGPAPGGGGLDGHNAWLQFLASYVLEIALSLDNIAVLALVFAFFRVPRQLLGRVLFWSMLFSLVARLLLINGAAAMLREWDWFHWVLGAVLAVAMVRTLVLPDENTDFNQRWSTRVLRRFFRVSTDFHDQKLLAREDHIDRRGEPCRRWCITPLLLVVLVAWLQDIGHAADSIPALFSVTKDGFLAFTGSAMAILSLRSLYFAVAGVVGRFRYLKISLVFVLLCVAAKAFVWRYDAVATVVTIGAVSLIMVLGVGLSVLRNRAIAADRPATEPIPTPLEDLTGAVEVTRRNLRKVLILIAGTFVVLVGIAIAPLPGPGPTVLVPIGLALLATEFLWARRLLDKVKTGAFSASDRMDALIDRTSVSLVPLILILYWPLSIGLVLGGVALINAAFGTELHARWYTIAVIVGSPYMPVLLWAVNYLRNWNRKRRGATQSVIPSGAQSPAATPGAASDGSGQNSRTDTAA